ncbi:MAG: hypothetical protein VB097_09260 [Rikenellaceae bacterium]|nr:hypothetical protein [Rikenellaceae bacterium]
MSGFSFRSFVLQIIPGVLILVLLVGLFRDNLLPSANTQVDQLTQNSSLWMVAGVFLLMVAFAFGVLVDFVADMIESLLCLFFKQPVFYLLTKKQWMGISLAHRSEILKMLCSYAALKYHPGDLYLGKEMERNINNSLSTVFLHGYNSISKPGGAVDRARNSLRHKIAINYLLQVTKNRCFIGCNNYQKEQMESFFELYIFSRNVALTLLCSVVFLAFSGSGLALAFLPIPLVFALASYRYNLYYCRLMLGSMLG